VATVFEPAMARKMFPCFDDPFMKAWYKVRLIHPKGAAVFHTTMEEETHEYRQVNQFKRED
jgi:aminopeptidase N